MSQAITRWPPPFSIATQAFVHVGESKTFAAATLSPMYISFSGSSRCSSRSQSSASAKSFKKPHLYPFPSSSISQIPSSRPPPNKLPQILPRRNAQHKPPRRIRHDRETLLLPAVRRAALEKRLQLLQRRLHRDQRVPPPLAPELDHRGLDAVGLGDRARRQLRFDRGRRDVAQQGFGARVHDGQVRVVALEGGEERLAERGAGVRGEGGARVEVFDYGLGRGVRILGVCGWRGAEEVGRTPRYLEDQF